MTDKPKKKVFIILVLISICIIFLTKYAYTQHRLHLAQEEFNEIMRIVDEDVPPLMCESLKNDPLIQNVEVTIHSSVIPEKYHDWYSWVEDCIVVYTVSDSFDMLSRREQYEFIDNHGSSIYSVKSKITRQLAPLHDSYGSFLSEENDMLCKIYGQTVFTDNNYDVYFKTSKNTYEHCRSVDDLMIVNGKDVWVHPDPSEYTLDAPYVGMDDSYINKTKLGTYSSAERCRDYYSLRPDHRSITYIWRDASGKRLFEAYALAGEVISTTDFRGEKIVAHGPNDKE